VYGVVLNGEKSDGEKRAKIDEAMNKTVILHIKVNWKAPQK
jgi:hypothetical protein